MATSPSASSAPDERTFTALFLLSLALRPAPDGAETPAVRIDRADLWKLASAAGCPVGRNKFHAATAALADDEDGEGWGCVVVVTTEAHNRRSVTVVRPDTDPDGWDEALDALGLTRDSTTEAAAQLGLDTASPLPGDLLQPLPAADEDDEDGEAPARTCTKCGEAKAGEDFPVRTNGNLSSWCRACTAAATKAAAARRNPDRQPIDPAVLAAREADQQHQAEHPHEKRCAACHKWFRKSFFYADAQKSDGCMTVCKTCDGERRHRQRLGTFVDF
jgi:hypothetical protein